VEGACLASEDSARSVVGIAESTLLVWSLVKPVCVKTGVVWLVANADHRIIDVVSVLALQAHQLVILKEFALRAAWQ
jgi:hypothetical protein